MNVTIIGAGHVVHTTGLALSSIGHDVTCVDVNERVIERLRTGDSAILEHGLPELLAAVRDHLDTGNLPRPDWATLTRAALAT